MLSEKVAVVGVGYVGITVACVLAEVGFETVGVDVDPERVRTINHGHSPILGKEPGLDELIEKMIASKRLRATTDIHEAEDRDAYFVCVDTPVDDNMMPRLDILKSVCRDIGRVMGPSCLVSIESTLPPRTMHTVVIPILEEQSGLKAGEDFSVVHCPERVMPGRLLHNLRSYSRVLGGIDSKAIEKAGHYYSKIIEGELYPTDLLSAEISKTAENAYRDVQIAFANEIALICERLGADAFEVRRLVNTCPFRDMHVPGGGVGGHCLPKDSWLLAKSVENGDLRMISGARDINELMPHHLAKLAEEAMIEAKRPMKGARISVMGLAFLRDSDDIRNSPAMTVVDHFIGRADVRVHDPFAITGYKVPVERDLESALRGSDCAVFVTDHSAYADLDLKWMKGLMRTPIIVDGRNIFDARACRAEGFLYRGIGKS